MKAKGKQAKEYRMHLVVKLRQEGHSQTRIAEIAGLSQSRVSDILKLYQEGGEAALVIQSPPGPTPGLDTNQLEELKSILVAEAMAFGFPTDGWTLKRVGEVVKSRFGKSYSLENIRRILQKIGFTRQRPVAKDYRRDEAKVDQWKAQTLPALKKSPERRF